MDRRTAATGSAGAGVARKRFRWLRLCGALATMGVAGVLFCAITTATGILPVPIAGLTCYATFGVCALLLWLVIAIGASGRGGGWSMRRRRLLYAVACLGAIVVAFYFLWWRPIRYTHDWDNYVALSNASDADIRMHYHRSLLVSPGPHDAFLSLDVSGDESSVPYMIWSLGWITQEEGEGLVCTWEHGLEALQTITNCSPGRSQYDWACWYRDNKHRTQLDWWADGFAAEGYAVSPAGDAASVRNLLAVLGRTPPCLDESKGWLTTNAHRMLAAFDADTLAAVLDTVATDGTVEQRRGLARYAGGVWDQATRPDRDDVEKLLSPLLLDADWSVRHWASQTLCTRQLEWLKNPSGFVVSCDKRAKGDHDEFFAPPDKTVIAGQEASEYRSEVSGLVSQLQVVTSNADLNLPACVIRVELKGYDDEPAEVSVIGRNAGDREVYNRPLITTSSDINDMVWVFDSQTATLYVSMVGFTCAVDVRTGQLRWEMGFGSDNCEDTFLLGPYLVINSYHGLVVCDAERGGIVASYELDGELWYHRVALVDGQIRASTWPMDGDPRTRQEYLYVLKAPVLPRR